ncbi:MAG: 50S ribosomal protein L25 [bacterium]
MAEIVLNVETRKKVGKKATKQLRNLGKVPGIYYFHGEDSVPIAVDEKHLKNLVHTETSIFNLKFDNGKSSKCVIREVQWDPLWGKPLHVDLMGVKLTERVTVAVPVHLVGTPAGVKQSGGILQHLVREIEIEALPLDIPEHLELDVSDLDIGDVLRVEDITIEKAKILSDPSQSIAVVRPPIVTAEPTVEEEEEEEEEEVTEPEVVGQKKEEPEGESSE